jgi:ferredoxin
MKPLAGGLLCESKAFPPRTNLVERDPNINARDILKFILAHEAVTCVVPGTASVAEAQENAIAGHNLSSTLAQDYSSLAQQIKYLQTTLCSRCGICDDLCSQNLPVSWLFRASYINLFPSETFETWDGVEYFQLHPDSESICANCDNITCNCPYSIDIPEDMIILHQQMSELKNKGYIANGKDDVIRFDDSFSAKVILHDIPEVISESQTQICRIYIENRSTRGWFPDATKFDNASVKLLVFLNNLNYSEVYLRSEVNCQQRTHFVFTLEPPFSATLLNLRLVLVAEHLNFTLESGLILYDRTIQVKKF